MPEVSINYSTMREAFKIAGIALLAGTFLAGIGITSCEFIREKLNQSKLEQTTLGPQTDSKGNILPIYTNKNYQEGF